MGKRNNGGFGVKGSVSYCLSTLAEYSYATLFITKDTKGHKANDIDVG